jgi:F-type H+-transporting ATPase subunit a
MGLEFLARVRRTTLGLAVVAGLVVTTYRGPLDGVAVALGAMWSLVNFILLEKLILSITGTYRGTPAGLKQAGLAIGGMLALFGAGGVLLLKLPPMWLLGGFLAPFAVMLLKAVSAIVLESRAWKAIVASPWRAAAVVAVLLVAAWWIVPSKVLSQSEPTTTTQQVATPQSGDPAHTEPALEHAGGTGGAEAAKGEGEEQESGPQKFPNVITVLHRAFPHAEWTHFLHTNEAVIFALIVALLLCIVAYFASRNPQMIPGGLQNVVEALVEGLYNFIGDIIGPKHAARFVPFLGTLGIYIWFMNLFGLIPFMDSPTSNLNVTFALGLTVFVYVQYIGMKELGFVGYIDHMLGQPRDITGWLLAPLMLPIHLLGELAKPISLSCRLFGNIFGEDMLLVAFVSLGITSLSFAHMPFGLPLQLPFLFLALLTSTLQAAVFMVLSTIYVLLMLPHEQHDEFPHAEDAQHAHH